MPTKNTSTSQNQEKIIFDANRDNNGKGVSIDKIINLLKIEENLPLKKDFKKALDKSIKQSKNTKRLIPLKDIFL